MKLYTLSSNVSTPVKELEVLPEAHTDFVFRWWYDWNVALLIIGVIAVGIIWWHVRRKR